MSDFEQLRHGHFVEMMWKGKVFVDPSWWATPTEDSDAQGDLATIEGGDDDNSVANDQLALAPLPAPVPSTATKYDIDPVIVHLDGCSHTPR